MLRGAEACGEHGGDDRLRGRRGLVKEGEESKRVRALCFGEWDSQDKGEANGLERVRFVRFWAEKNAPWPE